MGGEEKGTQHAWSDIKQNHLIRIAPNYHNSRAMWERRKGFRIHLQTGSLKKGKTLK